MTSFTLRLVAHILVSGRGMIPRKEIRHAQTEVVGTTFEEINREVAALIHKLGDQCPRHVREGPVWVYLAGTEGPGTGSVEPLEVVPGSNGQAKVAWQHLCTTVVTAIVATRKTYDRYVRSA